MFKVAEFHFKTITSVPRTKIDCKVFVSTLMKNPIIHYNKPKIRSKSIDAFIKKDIALNLIENLLTLYISLWRFFSAKAQKQTHKIKQPRLKSKSL